MLLKQKIEDIDLQFDDIFYTRCEQYVSLLRQWGKVHNLTSSKDLQLDIIYENIIDSIYPLKFVQDISSFADIGTGAGYPGMILAIALPNIKATLIEPRAKRVSFLRFVKTLLDLKNVEIIESRAQDIDCKFDFITSRAVTNISELLNITKDISKDNTSYLFYKGSLASRELDDAKIDNYELISIGEYRNYVYINNKDKR